MEVSVAGGGSAFTEGSFEDGGDSGSDLVGDEGCWAGSGLDWASLCEILRLLLGGMLLSVRCQDQVGLYDDFE